jgi:hypothetical protein
LSIISTNTHAALSANAVLTFDLGVCSDSVCTSGSFFGVETSPGSVADTPIEPFNGIVLGTAQPASGSHFGPPDGSESPDIDNPWLFFGNTGMHQSLSPITVVADDGAGNVTLEFSGWSVTWAAIPSIPLGSGAWDGNPDGLAVMTCANTCEGGDTYTVAYSATVPPGDPSGFGGVRFNLQLEGTVTVASTVSVTIDVVGGTTQECNDVGGSTVTLTADTTLSGGAELASADWKIDGASSGSGETITPFLTLGSHTIEVVATTTTGDTDTDVVTVEVVDTTSPSIDVAFLDSRTGEPISEVSGRGVRYVTTAFNATDICDPSPQTQGLVTPTFGVNDGDTIRVQGSSQTVDLPTTVLELSVTARDSSGNTNSGQAILSISE